MNRRQAKRKAADLVGQLIQQYLDAGQPFAEMGDDSKDATRIADAIEELRDEMWRRSPVASRGAPPEPGA